MEPVATGCNHKLNFELIMAKSMLSHMRSDFYNNTQQGLGSVFNHGSLGILKAKNMGNHNYNMQKFGHESKTIDIGYNETQIKFFKSNRALSYLHGLSI